MENSIKIAVIHMQRLKYVAQTAATNSIRVQRKKKKNEQQSKKLSVCQTV